MYPASKFGKIREREWLLDLISWRGDETVLDVGGGLGVMLIGAATGIDIRQTADLGCLWRNAKRS